jgi:hypothetical protein
MWRRRILIDRTARLADDSLQATHEQSDTSEYLVCLLVREPAGDDDVVSLSHWLLALDLPWRSPPSDLLQDSIVYIVRRDRRPQSLVPRLEPHVKTRACGIQALARHCLPIDLLRGRLWYRLSGVDESAVDC